MASLSIQAPHRSTLDRGVNIMESSSTVTNGYALIRLPGIVIGKDPSEGNDPHSVQRDEQGRVVEERGGHRVAVCCDLSRLLLLRDGKLIDSSCVNPTIDPATWRLRRDISIGMQVEADFELPVMISYSTQDGRTCVHLEEIKAGLLTAIFVVGQLMPGVRIHKLGE